MNEPNIVINVHICKSHNVFVKDHVKSTPENYLDIQIHYPGTPVGQATRCL